MARRTKALGPDIAKRFRHARDLSGLTVRELAERAHTSTTTLTKLADARGSNTGVGLLADIAKALGVRPAWLAYGDGPGPTDDEGG